MFLSAPSRSVARWFEQISGLLLAIICVLTVMNVFLRYVMNNTLGWADELSRFMFIWLGFIGATAVYASNDHVALTMFVRHMPPFWQRLARLLACLLETAVFGVFFWQGVAMAIQTVNYSPALNLPMWLVYVCVPAGGLMGVVYGIEKFWATLTGRFKEVL